MREMQYGGGVYRLKYRLYHVGNPKQISSTINNII